LQDNGIIRLFGVPQVFTLSINALAPGVGEDPAPVIFSRPQNVTTSRAALAITFAPFSTNEAIKYVGVFAKVATV